MGWLNSTYRGVIRLLFRPLKASATVPYCCTYDEPLTYIPPPDFKPDSYSGLIGWHVVEGRSASKLVCYWQDEPHYQRARKGFQVAMHTGSPQWEGALGDLRAKGRLWWPASLKEVVLAAAAVFGAITAIRDGVAEFVIPLTASPRIAVSFAVPGSNAVEGDPIRIDASAINETALVPLELNATATLAQPKGPPTVLLADPASNPKVDPGSLAKFALPVTAPKLRAGHAPPVDHQVALLVSARRIWFLAAEPSPAVTTTLKVWPRGFGWTRLLEKVEESPTIYNAKGKLFSSQAWPAGLHGTVTVVTPRLVKVGVNGEGFQWKKQTSSRGASPFTTVMEFMSPRLETFREYPFQVILTSVDRLPVQWAASAPTIRAVTFSE